MNVIVSNLNSSDFYNLDVDVIKSISGEFTADEIVQSFSNFFFNRMFLDITSIHDYSNINNLKTLSIGLDVSKIILYISNNPIANDSAYISSLISMGFYNLAKDVTELKYLYDNPNSYRDVAHLQDIGIYDETIDTQNEDNDLFINRNKSMPNEVKNARVVIGFKNFTDHAGATSLIFMLKKILSEYYYTIGIEINKRDFMFFNDKEMLSCTNNSLLTTLEKYQNVTVVLVDLNDLDEASMYRICDEIIYLMQDSTLMINRAVMLDRECFSKISDKKVLLNQSLLDNIDISRLRFESGINFFYVLPPLNDRVDNSKVLFPLLEKMGLFRRK